MPDFAWVRHPVFTPTACATCSTHSDKKGFVDLLVDTPVAGRMYLCGTCAERAGRELGMLSRDQADDLRGRLAKANDKITELLFKLEAEEQDKYISLSDAKKLFKAAS